jgi:ADP-ribose pyrophosphatase
MIKPWTCLRSRRNHSFHIFSVRTDRVVSPRTGGEHDFYVIESGDWVNIVPLTADGQVVMVRQYRHGAGRVTLEIPGGLVEPGDTASEAAARELLEETGYRAGDWVKIGEANPNPAIFANRCYTFLARDVRAVAEPAPDSTEDLEVELFPLDRIPELIRSGEIDHTLVIAAFHWYFLYAQQEPARR